MAKHDMYGQWSERKPALIYWDKMQDWWFAWDESGRLICKGPTKDSIVEKLDRYGFYEVPFKSRIAATIRDKLRTFVRVEDDTN